MRLCLQASRRNFLRLLLGLSGLVLMHPITTLLKFGKTGQSEILAGKLANFFRDKKSATVIGLEYLRSYPAERDVGLLLDRIFSTRSKLRSEIAGAVTDRHRRVLAMQTREDFECGRVVEVQGWILSLTEVRLCALVALL